MSRANISSFVLTIAFQIAIAEVCGLYVSDWRWWLISGLFTAYGAARSHDGNLDRSPENATAK